MSMPNAASTGGLGLSGGFSHNLVGKLICVARLSCTGRHPAIVAHAGAFFAVTI